MRFEDRDVTPIVNIVRVSTEALQRLQEAGLQDLRTRDRSVPIVELHKQRLGPQKRTWVGGSESKRFFIWEGETWRVFVHNTHGVSFEVNSDLTVDQAMQAWDEYRSKLLAVSV